MISRMTKFELPDTALLQAVDSVVQLFDQAKGSVFKLMASVRLRTLAVLRNPLTKLQDSVPKFMRDPKYAQALYDNNLDIAPNHNAFTQTLAHM